MKICLLSLLYGNRTEGGGVASYIETQSNEFSKLGHKVCIVTSGYNENENKPFEVVSFDKTPVFSTIWQLANPFFYFFRIRYLFKATKYILSNDFDVVEASDGGFEQLFLLFGKHKFSLITRTHGRTEDIKETGIFSSSLNILENLVLKKSDAISFISNFSYKNTQTKLDINKIYSKIIPCGVDNVFNYQLPDIRKKYQLSNKKIVLTVGRLSNEKGIDFLVRLAEKLRSRKDIIFVLLGSDSNNYFQGNIPQNIIYLGYKERGELASFYRESCFVLIPSRFETFGLSAIEAMSMGKTVLASGVGGLTDIVLNKKNGLIFSLDNLTDARWKLLNLVDNKKYRSSLEKHALIYSKQFDEQKIARKTISFYKKVIINKYKKYV